MTDREKVKQAKEIYVVVVGKNDVYSVKITKTEAARLARANKNGDQFRFDLTCTRTLYIDHE